MSPCPDTANLGTTLGCYHHHITCCIDCGFGAFRTVTPIPSASITADPSSSSSDLNTPPSSTSTSIPLPQLQNQESTTHQVAVPIFVVGLQSVNSDSPHDIPPSDENDMNVFGHHHGVGAAEVGGGEP